MLTNSPVPYDLCVADPILVGAFSMIVKTGCVTDGSFYSTTRNYDKGKWAKKAGGQNHNQQPNKKISLANIVDDIKDDGKLDEYTHNKKTEMKRWNVFEETGANDKSVSERKYDKHLLKKYKILKV